MNGRLLTFGFNTINCCNKDFSNYSNLVNHLRLHFQDLDEFFNCGLCSKKIASLRVLKAHINQLHSGFKHLVFTERDLNNNLIQNQFNQNQFNQNQLDNLNDEFLDNFEENESQDGLRTNELQTQVIESDNEPAANSSRNANL